MKSLHYIFTIISVVVWLFVALAFVEQKNTRPEKHTEIVMRDIGHRILLHAHDSTSRVLPVEKIDENTYQISFENAFTFVPDTLINIVHRTLAINGMPSNYTVSVKDCHKLQTVFAFEIIANVDSLTPCKGRTQQSACYLIHIAFVTYTTKLYFLMALGFITLLSATFVWWKKRKSSIIHDVIDENNSIPTRNGSQPSIHDTEENLVNTLHLSPFTSIGKIKFFSQKNTLECGEDTTSLSDRESKLLSIFADNINQVVTREHLLKEVWEDDGVLVMSRNLDVFVSKLRKKLISDPSIKIVNVHSKGYRLMVDLSIDVFKSNLS
jgi:DNA-binding winged helix-turn-helix (wHTH) protein